MNNLSTKVKSSIVLKEAEATLETFTQIMEKERDRIRARIQRTEEQLLQLRSKLDGSIKDVRSTLNSL